MSANNDSLLMTRFYLVLFQLEYVAGDATKPSVQTSRFAYNALGQTILTNTVKEDGSSYQILKYYGKVCYMTSRDKKHIT